MVWKIDLTKNAKEGGMEKLLKNWGDLKKVGFCGNWGMLIA